MRIIHGFCAILAVVGLIGSAETAYGQAGATGRAASTAATVENAVQGNAIPGAANTTVPAGTTTATTLPAGTATAASPAQVPVSGRLNTTSPGSLLTGPGNLDQQGNEREAAAAGAALPGTTPNTAVNASQGTGVQNSVIGNPPYTTATAPGTIAPGTVNAGAMNTRAYSSNYVPGNQAATTAGIGAGGYNAVNPMAATMPLGTYYSGAGVAPYGMLPRTNTYSSMYVTPGYTTAGQTYYTTPTQTYPVRQRRRLFGGLFRRNRVYATAPSTYTYGTAPGTYTYGTAPGTYTYAPAAPY